MTSYTTSSVIFTSKNIVPNNFNNTLELTLSGSSVDLVGCDVALGNLTMFNSVFNINGSVYGNNTFRVMLPYGDGGSTQFLDYSFTIPDGSYEFADINSFLQNNLIRLGFYLIDENGKYVYPIQISANSTQYACQIDLAETNSTLPSGWSYAKSGFWVSAADLPTIRYTPRIVIPNSMSSVFGIPAGTYPNAPSIDQTTVVSNIAPQISPVQSYFLRCSLVSNPFSAAAPDVLTSFSNQGTSVGDLITVAPPEYAWITVPDQSVSKITLTIVDQEFRFVAIRDPQIVIQLLIRQQKK